MCVPAWASFFNWGLAEPTRLDQCFDQVRRGFCIERLLEGVPAYIFDRNLVSPLSAKPPQNLAGFGVTFRQTNLTDGGSGVPPKVLRHEPHGGGNETGPDRGRCGRRRADRLHRPVQVREGAGEPKDVRRRLHPPLSFSPVEPVLLLVD